MMTRKTLISRSGWLIGSALLGGASLRASDLSYGAGNFKKEEVNMDEKPKRPKVKITVLRRECYQDLQESYLSNPKAGPCNLFRDGQEFIVDSRNFNRMLDGQFCAEAWDCISRYVYAALQGGAIMRGWTNDERMMIACCNDGTRPVIFKIERIDPV